MNDELRERAAAVAMPLVRLIQLAEDLTTAAGTIGTPDDVRAAADLLTSLRRAQRAVLRIPCR
jgi:hypothetical protein